MPVGERAMAYTLSFLLFDFGSFYSAGLPKLTGVLNVPAVGPASTATGTATPFGITFPAAPNPPVGPGNLLLTDPGGPGDYFRSGPMATWPPAPAAVAAGTRAVPLGYAT